MELNKVVLFDGSSRELVTQTFIVDSSYVIVANGLQEPMAIRFEQVDTQTVEQLPTQPNCGCFILNQTLGVNGYTALRCESCVEEETFVQITASNPSIIFDFPQHTPVRGFFVNRFTGERFQNDDALLEALKQSLTVYALPNSTTGSITPAMRGCRPFCTPPADWFATPKVKGWTEEALNTPPMAYYPKDYFVGIVNCDVITDYSVTTNSDGTVDVTPSATKEGEVVGYLFKESRTGWADQPVIDTTTGDILGYGEPSDVKLAPLMLAPSVAFQEDKDCCLNDSVLDTLVNDYNVFRSILDNDTSIPVADKRVLDPATVGSYIKNYTTTLPANLSQYGVIEWKPTDDYKTYITEIVDADFGVATLLANTMVIAPAIDDYIKVCLTTDNEDTIKAYMNEEWLHTPDIQNNETNELSIAVKRLVDTLFEINSAAISEAETSLLYTDCCNALGNQLQHSFENSIYTDENNLLNFTTVKSNQDKISKEFKVIGTIDTMRIISDPDDLVDDIDLSKWEYICPAGTLTKIVEIVGGEEPATESLGTAYETGDSVFPCCGFIVTTVIENIDDTTACDTADNIINLTSSISAPPDVTAPDYDDYPLINLNKQGSMSNPVASFSAGAVIRKNRENRSLYTALGLERSVIEDVINSVVVPTMFAKLFSANTLDVAISQFNDGLDASILTRLQANGIAGLTKSDLTSLKFDVVEPFTNFIYQQYGMGEPLPTIVITGVGDDNPLASKLKVYDPVDNRGYSSSNIPRNYHCYCWGTTDRFTGQVDESTIYVLMDTGYDTGYTVYPPAVVNNSCSFIYTFS